jgi:hypothetical protein
MLGKQWWKEMSLLSNRIQNKGKHTCKQLLLQYMAMADISEKWEIIASCNSFSDSDNKGNLHPQDYFSVGPFNKWQGDRSFFSREGNRVQYKVKIMMKEDKGTYKINTKKEMSKG